MRRKEISYAVMQRLPVYLNYLKSLTEDVEHISATAIANKLNLGEVQVRKDLASISGAGKPRVGYDVKTLTSQLETALGYNRVSEAVIVGAGRLGKALLDYKGFAEYGFNVVAGFDSNDKVLGSTEGGKPIYGMERLAEIIFAEHIKIGIITVPASGAQEICDELIKNGVIAIWNFSSAHLDVPEGILVRNENMAISLSMLVNHS